MPFFSFVGDFKFYIMKTETKIIYRCDHCDKVYFRKHFCVKHEKVCFNNPDNFRICFSCINLVKKHIIKITDNEIGTFRDKLNLFYCSKIHSCLYPPTVEYKQNWFLSEDFEDVTIDNIPMKKECKLMESDISIDEILNNF